MDRAKVFSWLRRVGLVMLVVFVAPMSWLVRSDVEEGRDQFNFSNWDSFAPGGGGD